MANPLTGDFNAVLQVSGGTVNRLLASMHQNADHGTPSFPHSIALRIGDAHAVDGVRGVVRAQTGVPSITLLHGTTDRFVLEVGIRAWYRPDPGTTPLPAFIHGTVRAEYRIHSIDRACAGWGGRRAEEHIWIRVVPNTVQFRGTAEEDRSPLELGAVLGGGAAADAANQAKITRQIAALLAGRFEASPHKTTSGDFRPGRMRTLSVAGRGSAVALPLATNGDQSGQVGSINHLLIDDSDWAIAVSREQLLEFAQPALAAIAAFRHSQPVGAAGISTVYRVTMNSPALEWQPRGASAAIVISASGHARTDSILPNATFHVRQEIILNFAPEAFWLAPGSRTVTARATGLGSGIVAERVKRAVNAQVQALVEHECTAAQPALDRLTDRKQDLVAQLKTLDAHAEASLDHAAFLDEGVVLRGTIHLAARRRPTVVFSKTPAEDGFTALHAWIPGGRIDKLEWSWSWAGTRPKGAAIHDDRFVLRRPAGGRGQWGIPIEVSTPLPGLDGDGTLCLTIRGVQVDPVTGRLRAIRSTRRCQRYGWSIATGVREGGRLLLRDIPELSQDVPFRQLGLLAAGGHGASANTLVIYHRRAWQDNAADTLHAALRQTRRHDAGLTLLALFGEGVLESAGGRLIHDLEAIGQRLGIPVVVNEDVRGAWSRAFRLESREQEQAWRLLSPHGGVTWRHDGPVDAEGLAAALHTRLIKGPPSTPRVVWSGPQPGMRVGSRAFDVPLRDLQRRCPPFPVGRADVNGSVITFVQRGSSASEEQLRTLAARSAEAADDGPHVIVVLDGADESEVESFKNALGVDFAAVADASGTITDEFGVRVWPTTVRLDASGVVTDVWLGRANVDARPDDESSDEQD
jgi:hypothetical protein